MAFAEALNFEAYLSELKQHGKVDAGTITYPFRVNDNDEPVLLNGDPRSIDVWSEGTKVNVRKDVAFAAIARRFPNVSYADDPPSFVSTGRSQHGGQEFVYLFELKNGCHGCEVVGGAEVAFDFDAQGHYLGARLLGVRRHADVAPAARGR
ncbi:MAG: hypothetical protein ABSA52_13040 [Candidatus Binatia bacterium]|jgi:hypothetical protein